MGILQVDGYAGCNRLITPDRVGSDIRLAYCWPMLNVGLWESLATAQPQLPEDGLRRIGELYRIEAELRGRAPEARLAGRQERSAPLVADLQAWLAYHRARVATKSPLGEARTYIAKYRDGLQLFLSDGGIEIDNNTVERTIRPIALNRTNALFAGYDAGAESWATIASLIETCKLNAVDPQTYLTATLPPSFMVTSKAELRNCCPGTRARDRRNTILQSALNSLLRSHFGRPPSDSENASRKHGEKFS